jgi:quercetin dioxygenase-like cupin family protein
MKNELNREFERWNGLPIYDKCVKDCHAKNLYSIVLKELENGRLLRLYVVLADNDLYKNDPNNEAKMSIGFHNHRYDIGLQVVYGQLTNQVIRKAKSDCFYKRYGFETGMGKGHLGQPKIIFKGMVAVKFASPRNLQKGDYLSLPSDVLHSISTPKNEMVAWLILEGKAKKDFSPELITNANLDDSSTENFYNRPSNLEVDAILRRIFK